MNEEERMAIIAEEIKKAVRGKLKEVYTPRAWEYIENPVNLGPVVRANGFGILKGLCGDTMRVYLKIESGTIREASFETDGCEATIAAGCAVTQLARGRTLAEALALSPAAVLEHLGGLPRDHLHCAILASTTLMNAVANYLILNADS